MEYRVYRIALGMADIEARPSRSWYYGCKYQGEKGTE